MARDITADSDFRYEGFASFPNSAAFEPNSVLEYASNVRIFDGVVVPRKGAKLMLYMANYPADYAVAAHHPSGADSIILWGSWIRFYPDNNSTSTDNNIPSMMRVRGQGYRDALCAEHQAGYWTCGGNITERLVTANNDQIRFTLYGGVKVNDTDTLSLVQGTYDFVKAMVTGHNSIMAFGSRSIYAIKAGLGYITSPKKTETMHQVQKLSSSDGVSGPDAVASIGGITVFFDTNRQPGIKVISGDKFNEGGEPMSSVINDIIDQVDPAKYDKVCIVACAGRFYVSLPFRDGKSRVLVLNPSLKGMFESLDEYDFNPTTLLQLRYKSKPRVYAVDVTSHLIYLLEENEGDDKMPQSGAGQKPITSEIRTRNFMFKTMADKRYEGFYVHMENVSGADVVISAITINPDSEQVMDRFSTAAGSTIRRGLIIKRSMGVKLKVVVTGGSFKILGAGVDASVAGRSLFSIY